jgi:flagellar assembly factor FliW
MDPQALPVAHESVIRIPLGLLGFERIKEFIAMVDPAEDPFLWLQVSNDPTLAFLVIPAQMLLPDYRPDITADDVAFLELQSPEDGWVLSIVTIRGPGQVTMNLKGPIVVNRRTLKAKQVIPMNAAEYSVQHPLPVAQS